MLLYCSYIFITYALVVQHTLWHECNTNRPNARECTNAACAAQRHDDALQVVRRGLDRLMMCTLSHDTQPALSLTSMLTSRDTSQAHSSSFNGSPRISSAVSLDLPKMASRSSVIASVKDEVCVPKK